MMSRLPEAFEQDNIMRMVSGEIAYTMPWAMYADNDRMLWINSNYPVTKEPRGTLHLKIQRTRDGVIVFKDSIGDHRYTVGGDHYAGEFRPLAVELR